METPTEIDNRENVEFFSGILIPGMVNAHTHLELSWMRRRIEPGCGFAEFADAMMSLRREAPEEAGRAASAAYRTARMYSEGVMAAADICNSRLTFADKKQTKLHFLNFVEYYGLGATSFPQFDAVRAAAREAGLIETPTPHSTYSLQDAPFRAAARTGSPLSIHFMESRAEAELFAGHGTLHERNERLGLKPDFLDYGSPVERLTASIPSEKKLLLVHNTFVDDEVVDRIENHFEDAATWVLCPRSNQYIEGTLPPVNLLRRKGVRIAVGTDSLASNDSLSLIEELKQFPEVPLHDMIRWVTLNGARALDIDHRAGSFEPGKFPGVVLLSGVDPRSMTLTPEAATRRII